MVNNFVFILTEGDHDAAFIYRILKTDGFSTYSKKIGDFPPPLNVFLQADIKNITIPEVKIEVAKVRFLPNEVLYKGDNLLLIYTLGGDSVKQLRVSLVKTLNAFNIQDPDSLQAAPEIDISVLYFYDADDKGVAHRLENIKEELKEVFSMEHLPGSILNNEVLEIEDMRFGAHIFTEPGTDKGMLEDVLLPLIEQDNEDILDAARFFLSIHPSTKLFSEKLTYDATSGVLKKVNGQKYSNKKSLVGTVGQLQKSGKSNTVCIRDADYLNDDKIKGSAACTTILQFISKVIK
jgi:hypothetical protein